MEGIGKNFYAHELLRFDFSQIHEEARRQEEIHPSNQGELLLAQGVFNFYNDSVIPLILSDTWVYEAALAFVEQYVQTYFNIVRLSGDQTYKWQKNLLKIKNEVVDVLVKMAIAGKAPNVEKVNLPKASDFTQLILFDKLTKQEALAVNDLHQRTTDHEQMQLTLTLKNICDMYEIGLPRVMFVVRRVIKRAIGEKPSRSENKLLQPSDYLDWYVKKCDKAHPLFPIIGGQQMQVFLKKARNVGSHHVGLRWNRDKNKVILEDRNDTLEISLYQFQQHHRYLVYLIDYGIRAILSAFCEAEQGTKANNIYKEYEKIFPADFPSGAGRGVKLYSEE